MGPGYRASNWVVIIQTMDEPMTLSQVLNIIISSVGQAGDLSTRRYSIYTLLYIYMNYEPRRYVKVSPTSGGKTVQNHVTTELVEHRQSQCIEEGLLVPGHTHIIHRWFNIENGEKEKLYCIP